MCCCCWRPFSSWWVTVDGLPVIAGVPGVTSVSAVPFELAVAGGHAVISFPAVDGILAIASISADPGVPFLTGGFTYGTVQ
jgi:hypothetical protein